MRINGGNTGDSFARALLVGIIAANLALAPLPAAAQQQSDSSNPAGPRSLRLPLLRSPCRE